MKKQIFPKSVKNIGLKNLFQLNSHFYTLKLSWHTEKSAVNLKSVYTGGLTITETYKFIFVTINAVNLRQLWHKPYTG